MKDQDDQPLRRRRSTRKARRRALRVPVDEVPRRSVADTLPGSEAAPAPESLEIELTEEDAVDAPSLAEIAATQVRKPSELPPPRPPSVPPDGAAAAAEPSLPFAAFEPTDVDGRPRPPIRRPRSTRATWKRCRRLRPTPRSRWTPATSRR
jgi:hypothetical protein